MMKEHKENDDGSMNIMYHVLYFLFVSAAPWHVEAGKEVLIQASSRHA